ncbi:MAG: carboxypeptidase regulatory-like domain-containing protein [Candidatus Methanolliviera hydrocarbonicum]|uniref:Carboxypeptidase regulatory-like domain-containing protein n=1 Tax=Candidatus Methanolliviera hydrocarbonicum TaxID=2491085 RepID=A0A520KUZ9_9EURY|nr:MAG: carboxypeptidase regulatory-like domain-containing protein [Candidatus Methanolliviera hydrocarbonicum]
MKGFILILVAALLISAISVPTSVALETKTDAEGIYTFSGLPPGTYTITATAWGPPESIAKKFGIKQAEGVGEITVALKEGEYVSKDIVLRLNKDNKMDVTPVEIGEGEGSISGKVLWKIPGIGLTVSVPSKLCEMKILITRYESSNTY